jgi:hypothetical protein
MNATCVALYVIVHRVEISYLHESEEKELKMNALF